MLRALYSLLACSLLGGSLEAQILEVTFKGGPKVEKRYRKRTTVVDGRVVFLGEAVPGGGVTFEGTNIRFRGPQVDPLNSDGNEFFVLDSEDPEWVPYTLVDGEKERKKKAVQIIPGGDIQDIRYFMRGEDIRSLSDEYRLRCERRDRIREERDAQEKGSVAWFAAHRRLLVELDRLESWLRGTSFVSTADNLEKERDKEAKASRKEALDERAQRALGSVEEVDVDPELLALFEEITGGSPGIRAQESQHIRIVYIDAITDARVAGLLEFGEQLIEGFRVEFVDPYVGVGFEDYIPDGLFVEFFFGPDDLECQVRILTEHYGQNMTAQYRELLRDAEGSNHVLRGEDLGLYYTRYREEKSDLDGRLTHNLGHVLASLHFNGGRLSTKQPWLEEGLGYYLSFEYRGKNTVTCRELRASNYLNQPRAEGDKTPMIGLRSIYNALALSNTDRIDKLGLKHLSEMEDADLAKSWSLFDYVAKDMNKDGQVWLRAGCINATNRRSFIKGWRADSEAIFATEGEDVFKVLDDRWRAYARSQQDTSEAMRKSD